MQVGKDGHASLKWDALASAGVHLDHMNTMKSSIMCWSCYSQEPKTQLSLCKEQLPLGHTSLMASGGW